MRRVLVVGTVPPAGDIRAANLGRVAAAHLGLGDNVEIVSPNPGSVAHRIERLEGLRLPLRLLWASQRFDVLVLRIEHHLPFRTDEGRIRRDLILLLLGLAARRFEEVTLRLDSPMPLPGGPGGRATKALWSRASVVVESERDRELVVAVPFLDPARVEIEPPGDDERSAPLAPWPAPSTPQLRDAVLDALRSRARAVRRLTRASEDASDGFGPSKRARRARVVEQGDLRLDLQAVFEAAADGAFRAPARRFVAHRVLRAWLGRIRARLG
jgi:hypothetical protein